MVPFSRLDPRVVTKKIMFRKWLLIISNCNTNHAASNLQRDRWNRDFLIVNLDRISKQIPINLKIRIRVSSVKKETRSSFYLIKAARPFVIVSSILSLHRRIYSIPLCASAFSISSPFVSSFLSFAGAPVALLYRLSFPPTFSVSFVFLDAR